MMDSANTRWEHLLRARGSVWVRGSVQDAHQLAHWLDAHVLDARTADARIVRETLAAVWPTKPSLVIVLDGRPTPEIEGLLYEAIHHQVHAADGSSTLRVSRAHRLWIVSPRSLGAVLERHIRLRTA